MKFVLALAAALLWPAIATAQPIGLIVSGGLTSAGSTSFQLPGPSPFLFAHPYYSCIRNFYVATTGSDSNTAAQAQNQGTPWLTIAKYDAGTGFTPTAGDCINIANGTYAAANNNIVHGGTTASSTGYIVYRCQTLNGCTLTGTGNPNGVFNGGSASSGSFPKYLIFDGFVLNSGQGHSTAFASGFNCINGDVAPGASNQCHHWWVINSIISWYGQTGIQLNDSEYFYAIHNTIFNNSQDCQTGAQGSGISFATPAQIFGGYTPTADDSSNPTMGIYAAGLHGKISWNVVYNNWLGCGSGTTSDGNGIIIDANGTTAGVYTPTLMIDFNIVFNNGGKGIHLFQTNIKNVIVANNDCYNNNLDALNNGTDRYCIGDNQSGGNNTYINNLVYAIPAASGILDNNSAIGLFNSTGAPVDTATSNITLCSINPPPGQSNCNVVFNGNTFSTVTNKANTNPLWVNVGNTTTGSETTPPNGMNFALQSGSPAIGYLTANSYLPPATRDAGACDRSFSQCP